MFDPFDVFLFVVGICLIHYLYLFVFDWVLIHFRFSFDAFSIHVSCFLCLACYWVISFLVVMQFWCIWCVPCLLFLLCFVCLIHFAFFWLLIRSGSILRFLLFLVRVWFFVVSCVFWIRSMCFLCFWKVFDSFYVLLYFWCMFDSFSVLLFAFNALFISCFLCI